MSATRKISILVLMSAVSVQGAGLSNLELYIRCYSQLTQRQPQASSVRYQQVAQNTKTAATACMEVLDSAALGANGRMTTINPESIAVITTLNRLHASFFTARDIHAQIGIYLLRTRDYFDSDSPAFYFTRALLKPNVDFSTVVTHAGHLRAIRTDQDPALGAATGKAKSLTIFGDAARFAPRGELIGIEESTTLPAAYSYVLNGTTYSGTVNFATHFGGGVVGSVPFLQQVFHEAGVPVPNGTLIMHRRWSKYVFSDLLGRSLPVLRNSDVAAFRSNNLSAQGFRRSSSCLACHATMDPLAGVARGLRSTALGLNVGVDAAGQGMRNLFSFATPSGSGQDWPVTVDTQFATKLPDGVLRYRNYRGQLVEVSVRGFTELGAVLAQQEDLYLAMAKRYYQYFLGVDVPLDPLLQGVPTSTDSGHLQAVETLAATLRSSQRVRALLQAIFNLPAYRQSGFGATP